MTVAAVAAEGRPDEHRKLLIAVGPRARQAVETDRCAAGRELVEAGSVAQAAEALSACQGPPASTALIALPGECLTYAALQSLLDASAETGVPIGVLPVGRDGRVPGAGREPAPPAPWVGAMYGHFHDRYGCGTEFGRQEVDGFLKRLSDGVEAAVFHVHGNGADLQLGNQVMCVQVDGLRGTPRPGDLTLPCQSGGPCRLEHLPLTTYWGASAMRARIVVLVSCWGYHPTDGMISPEVQLGAALFRGGHVESFIASTRVTFNTPQLAQAALAFLELGGTAGELALLLNRFPGTATPPYVCVGDPDVRVQPAGDGRHVQHECQSSSGDVPTAPGAVAAKPEDLLDFEELSRLERATRAGRGDAGCASRPAVSKAWAEARDEILAGFGPTLKEGRRARVGAASRARGERSGGPAGHAPTDAAPDRPRLYRGLTALVARHTGDLPKGMADAFWDLVHQDPTTEVLDEHWCRVQARLLPRRGPEQLGYLSSGSVFRDERLEPDSERARHLCGNRMFRITVEFTAVGGYLRELAFCERCGPVADVPAGTAAPFVTARYDGVQVIGAPWESAWVTTGVVPVGFSRLPASEPRSARLAEPIPLPPDLEFGRRLGVALVHGGEHILLETGLPHDPPPGRSTDGKRTDENSADRDGPDERTGKVTND